MLRELGKQMPYARMMAANNVAFKAMDAGRVYLRATLDRPTRFTTSAWRVRKKATKQDPVAVVGWSDFISAKRIGEGGEFAGAEYYLRQHWSGGGRRHKAFERQLIRARLMPAGMYAVPGEAAAELGMMDAHGNMKGPSLVAILSRVGAMDEMGYTANATGRQSRRLSAAKRAARQVYWAGKPGPNTPAGIWVIDETHQRGRGRLRPVLVFVRAPRYRRRLDLDDLGRQVVGRHAAAELRKAIQHALATAR